MKLDSISSNNLVICGEKKTRKGEYVRDISPHLRLTLLATLCPAVFLAQPLFAESPPFLSGMRRSVRFQMPLISVLIRQVRGSSASTRRATLPHNSSARSRESTNGASLTRDSRVPLRIPAQIRKESTRITATSTIKTPHTTASSRALKINVWVAAAFATLPAAEPPPADPPAPGSRSPESARISSAMPL